MIYEAVFNSYRSAEEINTSMANVYKHMSLAVFTSMIVSYFIGTTPELLQFFFTGFMQYIVMFAPIVAIMGITVALNSDPPKHIALYMLHGFAALMGLSFSAIFAVFTLGSIVSAFMASAVLFGTMSIYGYFTKRSLESMGQFLFVGLIAIMIASIINIFVGSTVAQMVISALAIVIFLGLTAYDTQQIRELLMYDTDTGTQEVIGALTLYLDFINIFLNLLQLFGDRK